MNNYRIIFIAGTPRTLQAAGFSAHGPTLTFYRHEGDHDPSLGIYAQVVNSYMFKMDDIHCVELVDEPVTI